MLEAFVSVVSVALKYFVFIIKRNTEQQRDGNRNFKLIRVSLCGMLRDDVDKVHVFALCSQRRSSSGPSFTGGISSMAA